MVDVVPQSSDIDGPKLFRQHYGFQRQIGSFDADVGGQFFLFGSAGDGGNDGCIACGIAEIILNHQNRTESILFTAEDGGEVGVIQIAALDFFHGIPPLISKQKPCESMIYCTRLLVFCLSFCVLSVLI